MQRGQQQDKVCYAAPFIMRSTCRKWHPDRNPNNKEKAEEKFREVGYQLLQTIQA